MERNLAIEALYLEVRLPYKKEICTHKFRLFSQPEFTLKKIDGVDSRYDPRIDLRKEEDTCFVPKVMLNIIGGIPPSLKNVLSEKISKIPSDGVPDAIMQPCNIDFNNAKMAIGNIQHISTNGTAKDHLVPGNGIECENDQESIDDLWNEMSSGQNNCMKFQNSEKSASLVANFTQNDNSPRQIKNENDKLNFSPSCPSSPEEFEGSNDLFSQMYQMNVQSKKKIIHFGRPKPRAQDSIMLSQVCWDAKFSGGQITSKIDERDAFERVSDVTFGISHKITPNEDEQEFLAAQQNKSQLIFSQNCEQNDFESIDEMTLPECSAGNLGGLEKEIDIGSFATGPSRSQVASYSQNDEQDTSEKNSAEMSDMFDEEIDAAMENYVVHSPKKALEFGPQSEILGRPQEMETVFEAKIDAGTQTAISSSIYWSYNKTCNCAKSSPLKRSLQALSLESVVCKKPKTVILSSPNVILSSKQVTQEIIKFWDFSNGENKLDASQHLVEFESSSERPAANNTSKNVKPSPANIEQNNQNIREIDGYIKMEQDENDDDTELQDLEVPRSVMIGTLPIHPPANFCWENDRNESVEDDVVDGGTPSKSKALCRLRLGLSRRARPKRSLHRAL